MKFLKLALFVIPLLPHFVIPKIYPYIWLLLFQFFICAFIYKNYLIISKISSIIGWTFWVNFLAPLPPKRKWVLSGKKMTQFGQKYPLPPPSRPHPQSPPPQKKKKKRVFSGKKTDAIWTKINCTNFICTWHILLDVYDYYSGDYYL